jgi:hypothetical protein
MDSNFWFPTREIEASESYRADIMAAKVMVPPRLGPTLFFNPVAAYLKVPLV